MTFLMEENISPHNLIFHTSPTTTRAGVLFVLLFGDCNYKAVFTEKRIACAANYPTVPPYFHGLPAQRLINTVEFLDLPLDL